MSKFRIFIFMFIFGFICLALDVNVTTKLSYPNDYKNTDAVTGEFQYNNIASNYNARCTYEAIYDEVDNYNVEIDPKDWDNTSSSENKQPAIAVTNFIDEIFFKNLQIDIFNDFLGYILIFIACLGFSKSNLRFKLGAIASAAGFLIHGVMVSLPFFTNGLLLCNAAFAVGISYLGCFILTGFLISSGFFQMCPGVSCRDERKWGKAIAYMILVEQILITFIYWLSTDYAPLRNLSHFFVFIEVCTIIRLALILKRTVFQLKENYKQ